MKNIFKYGFFALGGLVVVVLAIVAYIAATFDPNQYKPQIVQLVKDKTQRTLRLGDIKLSFFPGLGVKLGDLSLSEHKSDKEFIVVESARVSLKLMPLLSKLAVVDEVEIRGVRLNLIRFKDGSTNMGDLLGVPQKGVAGGAQAKSGKPEQFKFDIDHVSVENTTLNYTDEKSGTKYALRGLNLKTGRIANGVPGDVELGFNVQGNQPKFDLTIRLKTRLTFDLDNRQYLLQALDLAVKGEAAGVSKLVINASGDLGAKLQSKEFAADRFKLAMTGVQEKNNLDVKLEAPRLSLLSEKFSGDKVTLVAKMTGAQANLAASVTVPKLEGTAQAFKTGAIDVELDAKQGERTVKARLATPLSGNFQAQQFSFPAIAGSFNLSAPDLPVKKLNGEVKGSATADLEKQNIQASLSGKVADSTLKARLGIVGFSKPAIGFDVDIDQLDVDRYLPPKQITAGKQPETKQAEAKQQEKPLDFSALKNLNANGSLRVGNLKVANVKAQQVRVDLKAANGKLDINPLSANLYQGSANGSVAVNAAATPVISVKQDLKGISIGPLLKDAMDYDTLEGKGSVSLDVTTRGDTVPAMKKALDGKAALNLADGSVKGINIAETIRNFKAKLGVLKGQQTQAADKAQKTDFTELQASFLIKNGVAHNDDLSLKSPLLRLSGNGDINIGEDSLNYLAKASIVESGKGQGGAELASLKGVTIPVRISGPFKSPQYNLDFGAAATEIVKQKAEEAVKGKLQEKLKGLLGK